MQNLHFQTSLVLGVAFKSVHNLTPPPPPPPQQKEVKFNTILMFTCGKNTLGIEHIIRI